MKRRIVFLAERIDLQAHKTANVLLRYLSDEIVGIIDPYNRGKTVDSLLGGDFNIPIFSTIDELLEYDPTYLMVGFLPAGGTLKTDWYPVIIAALQSKMNVVSGLHQNLQNVAEFSLLAKKYKVKLIHLRQQSEHHFRFYQKKKRGFKTILIMDTKLSAWDLATAIELFKSLKKRNFSVKWLATSVLGNLINKKDKVAESVWADQLSAYMSGQVYRTGKDASLVLVEGFASLNNLATTGVAVSIMSGSQPDGIVLCHTVSNSSFGDIAALIRKQNEIIKILSSEDLPPQVIGLSLNTAILNDNDAKNLLELMEREFSIPAVDPVRFGCQPLIRKISASWPQS